MSLPRFSIRAILFAALIVACDCAVLRFLTIGPAPIGLFLGLLGILPMSHVLAIVWYRNQSRRAVGRPFSLGFLATGAATILVWFGFCLEADEGLVAPFNRLLAATTGWLVPPAWAIVFLRTTFAQYYHVIVTLAFFFSISFVPQLLLALSGGWTARRLAVGVLAHAAVDPGSDDVDASRGLLSLQPSGSRPSCRIVEPRPPRSAAAPGASPPVPPPPPPRIPRRLAR